MAFSFNRFRNGSSFYKSVSEYRDGTDVLYADVVKEQAIGEAIASPASYTVLDRLKTIATSLAGTLLATIQNNGWAWTSSFGVTGAVVTSADVTTAAAITDAPTTGQKIVVDSVEISSAAAIIVDIQEETSGTIIAKYYMAVNSTVVFRPSGKVKLATVNKRLMVHASGAGAVSATAVYHSEA